MISLECSFTFLSFWVIFSKKYLRNKAASSIKQFHMILSAKEDTFIKYIKLSWVYLSILENTGLQMSTCLFLILTSVLSNNTQIREELVYVFRVLI